MSSALKVRFTKYWDHGYLDSDEGVKTNIYPIKDKSKKDSGTTKGIYNAIIPFGFDAPYEEFQLEPGNYLIESILPSGNIVREDVLIPENETVQIDITDEQSPHEHLAWQQFSGNLTRQNLYTSDSSKSNRNITSSIKKDYERIIKLPNEDIKIPDEDVERISVKLLGERSSAIWKQITGMDTSKEFSQLIDKLDELLLTGMLDVSNNELAPSYFNPDNIWTSLIEINGPEKNYKLNELFNLSYDVKKEDLIQNILIGDSVKWLNPSIQDEEVNYFIVEPWKNKSIRKFIAWTPKGAELVMTPNEWYDQKRGRQGTIEIMLDASESDFEFRVNSALSNTFMSAPLAYLTSGALPSAKLYINKASEMLFYKMSNPYAAVAGAYILLETLDWNRFSKENSDYYHKWRDWRKWIFNLYNRFEWLPDGAVLHGWSLITQDKYDEAAKVFKKAYKRGIPIYSAILKKLLEGLKIVSSKEDIEIQEMRNIVRMITWRTNMSQLFTTVRLGPSY